MIDKTHQEIKPQAIVFPIRTKNRESQRNVGMGLHFLLGNVMILNSGLKEMWFGWRVKKIFPEYEDLMSYCRNESPTFNITRLGHEQKIRYWLAGVVTDNGVEMELTDVSEQTKIWRKEIPYTCEDHLIGFRKTVMDWMATCGLPFQKSEYQAALWPEKISTKGLHIFQRALENVYTFSSYDAKGQFEIQPFEAVVDECPASFMALDLLGWARYRRQEFGRTKDAFLKALTKNAAGVGVMAGLMWCGVMTGNEKEALYWATQKAKTRQEDIEAAREKALRLLKKYHN
jgi:hypothetical protein